MEARVAVLEANIGFLKEEMTEVRKDVRELRGDVSGLRSEMHAGFDRLCDQDQRNLILLAGMIIVAVLGLAGLMAKGFHWL
jgi:hypothetical protein